MIFDPNGRIQIYHQNMSNVIEIAEDGIKIATNGANKGSGESTGTIHISSGNIIELSAPTVKINSDKVLIGNGAGDLYGSVKGQELVTVLKAMVAELAAKSPQGSSLIGNSFDNILSDTVRVAK